MLSGTKIWTCGVSMSPRKSVFHIFCLESSWCQLGRKVEKRQRWRTHGDGLSTLGEARTTRRNRASWLAAGGRSPQWAQKLSV